MRTFISTFLLLLATASVSQTRSQDAEVFVEVDPVFNKVTVKLKTGLDSLKNCKVQIKDAKNTVIKTAALPKATKQMESSIAILDLGPGQFTCYVYHGREEIYKGGFSKDAVLMEPQVQPVIHTSEN